MIGAGLRERALAIIVTRLPAMQHGRRDPRADDRQSNRDKGLADGDGETTQRH
jgi:hypothetical protein